MMEFGVEKRCVCKLLRAAVLLAGLRAVVGLAPMRANAQTAAARRLVPAISRACSPFSRKASSCNSPSRTAQLSGFISRFGDTDSDKGEFIDQFFDKASLQGDHLYFKTKTVHAVWYEFDGTLTVVPGKQKGEEGYRVIRGKLTLHTGDAKGDEQASEKTVEFKSFPDMRSIVALDSRRDDESEYAAIMLSMTDAWQLFSARLYRCPCEEVARILCR